MLRIAANKVVRLPGGKFITRRVFESTPESLERAKPEELWVTGDKREILITDMDTRHLLNAMKTIETRAKAEMARYSIQGAEDLATLQRFAGQFDRRYFHMRLELARRANGQPKPEGIRENTERKFEP